MKRSSVLIAVLALLVCVGLTMGCGSSAKQQSLIPPSFSSGGNWVGTVTNSSFDQMALTITMYPTAVGPDSSSGTPPMGLQIEVGTSPNDLTVNSEECSIAAGVTGTVNAPIPVFTDATNFTITANQPTSNEESATINGVYNPSTPDTFTGSMSISGYGCADTATFTVTKQP
jgi:hypothetical protein